jgi:hypothetical protein
MAEDPVRNNNLTANITDVTSLIIETAKQIEAGNLQEQIDCAISLVAWHVVAPEVSCAAWAY